MKGINWIGVVAALVAGQAIGFAWYGMVFQEQWMALSGITPSEAEGGAAMMWGMVQNLVICIGLGWLIARAATRGWPCASSTATTIRGSSLSMAATCWSSTWFPAP